MDTGSQQAAAVLSALVTSNERLVALTVDLRSRAEVVDTSRLLTLTSYNAPGSRVALHVEAVLRNGRILIWSLELLWGEHEQRWTVTADLSVVHQTEAQGEDIIRQVADRVASTVDDVVVCIEHAMHDLIALAEAPQLERLTEELLEQLSKELGKGPEPTGA